MACGRRWCCTCGVWQNVVCEPLLVLVTERVPFSAVRTRPVRVTALSFSTRNRIPFRESSPRLLQHKYYLSVRFGRWIGHCRLLQALCSFGARAVQFSRCCTERYSVPVPATLSKSLLQASFRFQVTFLLNERPL